MKLNRESLNLSFFIDIYYEDTTKLIFLKVETNKTPVSFAKHDTKSKSEQMADEPAVLISAHKCRISTKLETRYLVWNLPGQLYHRAPWL